MKKQGALISLSILLLFACSTAPVFASDKGKEALNPIVILSTNMGDITVELDQARAPISVKNFMGYAESGFYNGTVMHRVIPGFMIQGGGFTQNMQQKSTRPAIKNEAQNGLSNKRGTIAMARTSVVNSATSQFFINLADNVFLDHGVRDFGYAVFGRVIDGMDVVDKISNIQTGLKGGHQNVPLQPVIIAEVKKK